MRESRERARATNQRPSEVAESGGGVGGGEVVEGQRERERPPPARASSVAPLLLGQRRRLPASRLSGTSPCLVSPICPHSWHSARMLMPPAPNGGPANDRRRGCFGAVPRPRRRMAPNERRCERGTAADSASSAAAWRPRWGAGRGGRIDIERRCFWWISRVRPAAEAAAT